MFAHKSLLQELQVWKAVDHPNVLWLRGFAFTNDLPAFVADWMDRRLEPVLGERQIVGVERDGHLGATGADGEVEGHAVPGIRAQQHLADSGPRREELAARG